MNNDFVPFELAVKLKEKGSPPRTFGEYDMQGACYIEDGRFYENGCITEAARAYTAPTISQVLNLLREEKKIYVSILPFATHSTINKVAFYYLIEYNSTGETMEGIEQNTYCAEWKDAALAGIEYVLNNLI